MATPNEKFAIKNFQIGRAGNDSIFLAHKKSCEAKVVGSIDGSRGTLEIWNEGNLALSFDLSGITLGDYVKYEKLLRNRGGFHADEGGDFLVFSKPQKGTAGKDDCVQSWVAEYHSEKFALCSEIERAEGVEISYSEEDYSGNGIALAFEIFQHGELLAVISAFGISAKQEEAWLCETSPIGKRGELSKEARAERVQKNLLAKIARMESALHEVRMELKLHEAIHSLEMGGNGLGENAEEEAA